MAMPFRRSAPDCVHFPDDLARQDADSVSWEHVTDADGVARVATTFTGVRDELE
jgi:hypothetical protein